MRATLPASMPAWHTAPTPPARPHCTKSAAAAAVQTPPTTVPVRQPTILRGREIASRVKVRDEGGGRTPQQAMRACAQLPKPGAGRKACSAAARRRLARSAAAAALGRAGSHPCAAGHRSRLGPGAAGCCRQLQARRRMGRRRPKAGWSASHRAAMGSCCGV